MACVTVAVVVPARVMSAAGVPCPSACSPAKPSLIPSASSPSAVKLKAVAKLGAEELWWKRLGGAALSSKSLFLPGAARLGFPSGLSQELRLTAAPGAESFPGNPRWLSRLRRAITHLLLRGCLSKGWGVRDRQRAPATSFPPSLSTPLTFSGRGKAVCWIWRCAFPQQGNARIEPFHFLRRKIVFSFPHFAGEFPGDAMVGTWLYDLVSWLCRL